MVSVYRRSEAQQIVPIPSGNSEPLPESVRTQPCFRKKWPGGVILDRLGPNATFTGYDRLFPREPSKWERVI
jgi:hypothetical protein